VVRGEVVRLTGSVAYVEATVHDRDRALVSRATATFFVRRRSA
jgi:acyl-coenzyme A thioesterase PaaI-like protein